MNTRTENRMHTTTRKHWALNDSECPKCKASKGHACIRQERNARLKLNFERYPETTVHAIRCLEMGSPILADAPSPRHLDRIPANAVMDKQSTQGVRCAEPEIRS